MDILKINHLRKSFGSLEVLKDISLTVKESEVLSIIGPSGSGKSTALRCATMLETMDGGDLIYSGEYAAKDVDGVSVYADKTKLQQIKRDFSLVFQSFNLFPHYSVLKNITDAPIHVQKKSKKEAEEKAMELLAQMGLADKADSYPCQLSGGQQQRVSIARALAGDPSLILADEPTGALDSKTSREVLDFLKQLNQEGNTIVMITHDSSIALEAKRVVRIQDGKINFDGDVKDYAAIL